MKAQRTMVAMSGLTLVITGACLGDPSHRGNTPHRAPTHISATVIQTNPRINMPSGNQQRLTPGIPPQYNPTGLTPGILPLYNPTGLTPGSIPTYNPTGMTPGLPPPIYSPTWVAPGQPTGYTPTGIAPGNPPAIIYLGRGAQGSVTTRFHRTTSSHVTYRHNGAAHARRAARRSSVGNANL